MVRVDKVRVDRDIRNLIRAGNVHSGELAEEARVGGVGTIVDRNPRLAGGDGAVVAHAGGDVDHHAFTSSVGCEELLAA